MRACFFFVCSFTGLFAADDIASVLQDAGVKRALELAKEYEPQTVNLQVHVCEIPAPPFHEQKRAIELKRLFEELGLRNVRIDQAGNVIGERPGRSTHPNVVFAAHLDTVFPEGTNVAATREGVVLKGPGIGDDCRGLAVMLAVIRALNDAKVETPGPLHSLPMWEKRVW